MDRTGTAFAYNHLNLPKTASRAGVSVSYRYDALGTKLQKYSKVGDIETTRDYVGGIEYKKEGTGPRAIDLIMTEEGYLQNSNGSYVFHYYLRDHLGNVRAVLRKGTAETASVVVQQQDYYAFGKTKSIVTGGINSYLYNGKERQAELGDQLDYGARFYDAEIGRWNVVDPAADYYPEVSPYAYVLNDPLSYTDENGEIPGPVGAVIGIAADYVQQVGLNYFVDGKDFRTSLTDVSYWSLAVSGASGFASGGITSLTNTLTSKVGQKALTKIIDVGVDVMVSTVESAVTNKLEGGDLDVWKSFTGGLLEAGIAKYIPLKYVDKLEKKLFKKMKISANKAEKYKRRMANDSHRNKNTQKRNRTKYEEYSKKNSSYTRAYMGVKTVNDAYKAGGAEALQQLDLYLNIPPSPRPIIEVGTPTIVK